MKKEKFIEKAKKVHGNKYDYSMVEYVNNTTKVCIICPKHGEFWQRPHSHLRGSGCNMCSNKIPSTVEFIEKAKKVHGDKYDYSKVEYVNAKTKICIICHKHGEFWQLPNSHLNGQGCKACAIETTTINNRHCFSDFLKKANCTHNSKYSYDESTYVNTHTKMRIICPEHGEFWQQPCNHILGQKCPQCARNDSNKITQLGKEKFIEKANEIHDNKYDYSKVEYINLETPVCITCLEHGDFWQRPSVHLCGCGCKKCSKKIGYSKAEKEIVNYIKRFLPNENILENNTTILNGQEIDIYIPNKKIAFEYNGLIWHSEMMQKDKQYHIAKTKKCEELGIKLYQIFEDEFEFHKDIVLNKIKHILHIDNNEKIYARNCKIREITYNESKEFLDRNHIQGSAKSTLYLGCFYKDKLVGVMCFLRQNENKWILNRFATDINYNCIGVGGKLLAFFEKHHSYCEIKSFADIRWTPNKENNLYNSLGFKLESILAPDYKYVHKHHRIHKFNFRKERLHKKYGLPLTMTEKEMCDKLKIYRIWDCGLYVYTKKN